MTRRAGAEEGKFRPSAAKAALILIDLPFGFAQGRLSALRYFGRDDGFVLVRFNCAKDEAPAVRHLPFHESRKVYCLGSVMDMTGERPSMRTRAREMPRKQIRVEQATCVAGSVYVEFSDGTSMAFSAEFLRENGELVLPKAGGQIHLVKQDVSTTQMPQMSLAKPVAREQCGPALIVAAGAKASTLRRGEKRLE